VREYGRKQDEDGFYQKKKKEKDNTSNLETP
jgi:hypothetical protein